MNLLKYGTFINFNKSTFSTLYKLSLRRWQVVSRRNNISNILKVCMPIGVGIVTSGGLIKYGISNFIKFELSSLKVNCESTTTKSVTSLNASNDADFNWKLFLKFLYPELFYLILAITTACLGALCNIKIPLYLGKIVDVVAVFTSDTTQNFVEMIKGPAVAILLIYFAQCLCTISYISILSSVGERLTENLKSEMFNSVIQQDMLFYDSHKSGEIINRLSGDIQDFKSSFKLCISQGLRSVTQIVGSVGALLYISPSLTGIVVIILPLLVGCGSIMGSFLRSLSRKASDQNARATEVASEAVSNIKTVKAFAMEDYEMNLFKKEVHIARENYIKLGYGIALFQGLSNLALNGITLGVLYTGGWFIARQELSAGDLMSFLVASQTIQRSLAQLSLLFGSAVRGFNAGARVFEYISLPSSSHEVGNLKHRLFPSQQGLSLELRNVSFSYPSRSGQVVLKDLSLSVPAGKVLAVCGESGAGKSTLVALIERFYEAQHGEILLDGQDICSIDTRWLRRRLIGLISQEPQLFHTSVRENIRYGRPDASDFEVEEAARLANAHEFVRNFPDGYDTLVGERGTAVSGGQKQRIAIARALLKDPALLLLDEATSALDAESEHLVQEALQRVMKDRTVIIIAHRLSTIRDADVIAVMSKGRIVEKGSHEELIRRRGAYWRLVQHQENSVESTDK